MLLIITNKADFAVDFLITKLIEKNLPYLRINSEDIGSIGYNIVYPTGQAILEKDGVIYNLKETKTVWYRRSISPSYNNFKYSLGENHFINGELKHLMEGLILNLNAKWVNSLDSVYLGERKLYQLAIASELGFNIPKSMIVNDYKSAKTFFNDCNGNVICKPIFHGLMLDQNSAFAIHTNRVQLEDLKEIKNSLVPTYLQEEVQRISDLRITVIGEDIFSVEITHDVQKTPDWRAHGQEIKQRITDIPVEVKKRILSLMKRLNLNYGAIDLIKKEDGEFVFLEINPAGEWAWIENDLGLALSESFIKLFYGVS